jgi:hypothetical protein
MAKNSRKGMQEAAKETRRDRILKLLEKIEKIEIDVPVKVTVADFVRLTQLARELEEHVPPREIKITWIDRIPKSFTGRLSIVS